MGNIKFDILNTRMLKVENHSNEMLTLNINQAMSDIKSDNLVRKKLLGSFVNLAQLEEDASICQQDSLASLNDCDLKFGTFSNITSAKTSLDNVYKKWINFCVKEDLDKKDYDCFGVYLGIALRHVLVKEEKEFLV